MGEGSDVEEDLTCSPDKKGCLSPALFSLVCDKVSFSLESIRKTYYKPAKLILTGLKGQRAIYLPALKGKSLSMPRVLRSLGIAPLRITLKNQIAVPLTL